ncbi:hypothetical protein [Polaribacter litorisediminis]|uniref:hypothetical protein n=1 Tax=Polaribacter litorisediminis TaxID=1908341 RepID=UPI001CBAB3F6|nr:hypothetical protein [Polaribacter litorisediminis]
MKSVSCNNIQKIQGRIAKKPTEKGSLLKEKSKKGSPIANSKTNSTLPGLPIKEAVRETLKLKASKYNILAIARFPFLAIIADKTNRITVIPRQLLKAIKFIDRATKYQIAVIIVVKKERLDTSFTLVLEKSDI